MAKKTELGPLVFVDIETSGLNCYHGRVIEVGVLRVEKGNVVQTFNCLINPEGHLPDEITVLTGITGADLTSAPRFAEVVDELADLLDDAIFVAHNVRFDYSFLKQEFARCGREFAPKLLCTARLSRRLYPQERRHGLDYVIARHGLKVKERHRAFGDAQALWDFWQVAHAEHEPAVMEAAIAAQFKRQALPTWIDDEVINRLPDGPGVYVFEGDDGVLYVGKSVRVRTRVLSHFSSDHAHPRELRIALQTRNIRAIPTHGELSALLLESHLVKTLRPLHNRRLRTQEILVTVRTERDASGYDRVVIDRDARLDQEQFDQILGIYKTYGQARTALRKIAKEHALCEKLMGLEKGSGACFGSQLKRCAGACVGKEKAERYNARVALAFMNSRMSDWPYDGPVSVVEHHETLGSKTLLLDKWRVIGESEGEQGVLSELATRPFDLDTFKILRQYFKNPRNRQSAQPMIPA